MNAPAKENTVELVAGESRVLVCPAIGGAIARYAWRESQVLRRAPDAAIAEGQVRQMGCYPLVPYSNRIGHARLPFGNEIFTLRPNFLPEPHALHGVGWQRKWQVGRQSASRVQLDLAHEPDGDWPFRFEARQELSLGENALEVRLRIANTDARPMPAGLGFHPYFTLQPGVHLQAQWQGMWKMGEDRLPTEWVPVPPESDFRQLRPVEGWKVDHCFTGWKRHALLDYPTHRVVLTASELLERIVCFAPDDGRGFIALEPVSHINNAFALAAAGRTDTGMRVLRPGERLEAAMTIAPGGRGRG
jgi:aldose 1-epimerase